MGRCQPHQRVSVNFMEGEAAFPNNSEKGRTGKCKTNHSYCPRDTSTGEKNEWMYGPGWTLNWSI